MVQVGDRVAVESEKVGQPPRIGTVTEVQGHLLHIQWETGQVSTLSPASGALRVIGRDEPRKG